LNGWVMYSACDMTMHTGLSEILNHNNRSSPLLVAYVYTKLQTRWHIQCC